MKVRKKGAPRGAFFALSQLGSGVIPILLEFIPFRNVKRAPRGALFFERNYKGLALYKSSGNALGRYNSTFFRIFFCNSEFCV